MVMETGKEQALDWKINFEWRKMIMMMVVDGEVYMEENTGDGGKVEMMLEIGSREIWEENGEREKARD
ncbi:hypothetical protein Pmani_040146 [Petrolisthes manimaculis]|uniref:Uncharacterized protein n=1 Tax=Petrolisthes manimaculis TaxID=1843537 RepID=A0AAE1NBG5_9EUCA|nr:hypothetical protein Pmani_040146 [Petrolisthes manimaculis]